MYGCVSNLSEHDKSYVRHSDTLVTCERQCLDDDDVVVVASVRLNDEYDNNSNNCIV